MSLALKAPPCTSICFLTSLPCLEVISREARGGVLCWGDLWL